MPLAYIRGYLALLKRRARIVSDDVRDEAGALWKAVNWDADDAVKRQRRDGSQLLRSAAILHDLLKEMALVEDLIQRKGSDEEGRKGPANPV